MKIEVFKTNDTSVKGSSKVLLYAHHGAGKIKLLSMQIDR